MLGGAYCVAAGSTAPKRPYHHGDRPRAVKMRVRANQREVVVLVKKQVLLGKRAAKVEFG